MKWFVNLSTQNKLLLGFGVIIGLLVLVILQAYFGITSIHDSQTTLVTVEIPISLKVMQVRAHLNREHGVVEMMFDATKTGVRDKYKEIIKETSKSIDELLKEILQLAGNKPEYRERVGKLIAEMDAFRGKLEGQAIPLIYEGKLEEARDILDAQALHYEKIRDMAVELSNLSQQNDQKLWAESNHKVKDSIAGFLILGIVALVLGLAISVFLTRIIAGPLKDVSKVAEQIAYGNLTIDVPSTNRSDEVGVLAMTFGMMIEALRMITREIRVVTQDLSGATGEILQSVERVDAQGEGNVKRARTLAQNIKELGERLAKLIEQYKV